MRAISVVAAVLLCAVFALPVAAVEVEYWHPQQPPNGDVLDRDMAAEHMRAYPEVKIRLQEIPTENMADKMTLAVASGRLPDVVRDYLGRVGAWGNMGLLEDLAGTMPQEDIDDFYPDILQSFVVNGQLIGYPHRMWVQTYDANKTILDRAGVELPRGEWDMAQWNAMAEKISAVPGVYPTVLFAGGRGGDYWMLQVFECFGAHLYESGDYAHTSLNCGEGIAALEWMLEVLANGWAPAGAAGMSGKECTGYWNEGRIALGCAGTRIALPEYNRENFESGVAKELQDIRVVTQPHAAGAPTPGLFAGPSGFCVFRQDSDGVRNAAVAFVQDMTGAERSEYWVRTYDCLPVRRSVNPWVGIDAYESTVRLVGEYGLADMGIVSEHYLEARDLFSLLRQEVFAGLKGPREALDDFEASMAALWE